MKKFLSLLLLFPLAFILLTGCAENPQGSTPVSSASTEASEAVSQPVSSAASENSEEMTASASEPAESEAASAETAQTKLHVQVGDRTFTATLEDNTAVDALVETMEEAPIVLQLNDYSGFEKVGPLGESLPASDSQTTTQPGDIVLYQGDQIVLFYGSNTWSYTRLAHVDDLSGWEEALGSGDVTVTLSLLS